MGGASAKIIAVASPPLSGLLRRGLVLEYTTLGWNVVGVVVLAWSAISARSVAMAGFGARQPDRDRGIGGGGVGPDGDW